MKTMKKTESKKDSDQGKCPSPSASPMLHIIVK
uniref:Uncharacterized protein n=3 Tax=Anguilla TaxID=7935 RepID=A0A0E9T6J9_ANGAN